uniref:(California timema) hypothetical protein n=1 Tax=Timema californicum TaxID=61474 RepID=A0A7R9PCI0_TIMCA|nr:unnamed protein product [Timema californicum]
MTILVCGCLGLALDALNNGAIGEWSDLSISYVSSGWFISIHLVVLWCHLRGRIMPAQAVPNVPLATFSVLCGIMEVCAAAQAFKSWNSVVQANKDLNPSMEWVMSVTQMRAAGFVQVIVFAVLLVDAGLTVALDDQNGTTYVIQWSEFLATDPQVPGSALCTACLVILTLIVNEEPNLFSGYILCLLFTTHGGLTLMCLVDILAQICGDPISCRPMCLYLMVALCLHLASAAIVIITYLDTNWEPAILTIVHVVLLFLAPLFYIVDMILLHIYNSKEE